MNHHSNGSTYRQPVLKETGRNKGKREEIENDDPLEPAPQSNPNIKTPSRQIRLAYKTITKIKLPCG